MSYSYPMVFENEKSGTAMVMIHARIMVRFNVTVLVVTTEGFVDDWS